MDHHLLSPLSLLLSRIHHHLSCCKVFIICPIMHGPRPFVLQYLSRYHLSCYPGSSTIFHAVHDTPPSILLHWAHHHYSCYIYRVNHPLSSTTCLTIQDPPPSVLLYCTFSNPISSTVLLKVHYHLFYSIIQGPSLYVLMPHFTGLITICPNILYSIVSIPICSMVKVLSPSILLY